MYKKHKQLLAGMSAMTERIYQVAALMEHESFDEEDEVSEWWAHADEVEQFAIGLLSTSHAIRQQAIEKQDDVSDLVPKRIAQCRQGLIPDEAEWDKDVITLSNTLAARLGRDLLDTDTSEQLYWYGPRTIQVCEVIRHEIPAPLLEALDGLRDPLEHYCRPRDPREALSLDK